ncbi:MAG TPA: hypothetical protein VFL79_18570, partial [Terriglobia bacterium]|nr:hypothetical protein [Terriglobia bacterium]
YHIGCDETFELGRGHSQALVAQEGYGKVYVDNLARVSKLVESYNKQVMFWGDIATEHPEMISSLPRNLIVASWEYFPHPNYDKWLDPFVKAGLKIFVCPWVGNTDLIMPDCERAAANINTFIWNGKKKGAIGTIVTVWNDDGETLYGLNWWSIVYGAACSWELGQTSVKDFNQKYDWDFYQNTDHRFADAIERLSHVNEVISARGLGQVYGQDYGGTNNQLFWHNPFASTGQADVTKALPVAPEVRRLAEDAYNVFANSTSRARRNADTLEYLEFAALKLDALGMRYELMQEIAKRYAERDLSDISSTDGRLQDLRDYTTRLTDMYRTLWLNENLPTWLPNILQLYQRNSDLWQAKIQQFDEIRSNHRTGKSELPSADSLGLMPAGATAKK